MASLAELLDVDFPAWRQRAACRGVDPAVFFPAVADGERLDASGYAKARSICASCPVRLACLKEHLDELHGFWGNTSPRERVDLRRQRSVRLQALPGVVTCDFSVRRGA